MCEVGVCGEVCRVMVRARGVHSIVKLNTTCHKNKSIFYIKDQQNRSKFIFFTIDIHSIYYIVKKSNQI